MSDDARCTAHVEDGTFSGHRCPRPAKEDGLCAQHLAGRRRSEALRALREERRGRDITVRRRASVLATRVAELSGIESYPAIALSTGRHTGGISFSHEQAQRLIELLEHLTAKETQP